MIVACMSKHDILILVKETSTKPRILCSAKIDIVKTSDTNVKELI